MSNSVQGRTRKPARTAPTCPECHGLKSFVIHTRPIAHARFDILRRRHCSECGHRWYTGQTLEEVVEVKTIPRKKADGHRWGDLAIITE